MSVGDVFARAEVLDHNNETSITIIYSDKTKSLAKACQWRAGGRQEYMTKLFDDAELSKNNIHVPGTRQEYTTRLGLCCTHMMPPLWSYHTHILTKYCGLDSSVCFQPVLTLVDSCVNPRTNRHSLSFFTNTYTPIRCPPANQGWTLFQNFYMSNGTLFPIIPNSSYTPSTGNSESYSTMKVDGLLPEIRMMTSTGLMALNTPDNIVQREPTEQEMRFLSVLEAAEMWGKEGEEKRVWTVDGNTASKHSGMASSPCPHPITPCLLQSTPRLCEYIGPYSYTQTRMDGETTLGSMHTSFEWPFHLLQWNTRKTGVIECLLALSRLSPARTLRGICVGGWWDPVREAIWRFVGVKMGNLSVVLPLNEGNSVELVKGLQIGDHARLVGVSGVMLLMPEKIVITYISRQSAHKQRLLKEDHEALVKELKREAGGGGEKELVKGGGVNRKWAPMAEASKSSQQQPEWELQVLEAEHMTKDEQVRAASRTTVYTATA
ncbi:uncharacterized protein LACBIDRAFT_333854 [Laccaria bicolor S238N-H82]|uniref:Predicted protein n=1 Tax=Laccaria bicolor (strain S238N-H82 / ATCC MYA-4686) TaxID=486041 RepID=B0DXA5_LACBS|nr:uncharacterized protein LACBIDRAFT_333854 [Laccaria bicolor S238N-H82]EDR00799.1 predicted protein [Laccaria bicolor S238N-H82]|eukprot:XP_001888591.1 predicted protein [Laccaria bicolor S238N-H82]